MVNAGGRRVSARRWTCAKLFNTDSRLLARSDGLMESMSSILSAASTDKSSMFSLVIASANFKIAAPIVPCE